MMFDSKILIFLIFYYALQTFAFEANLEERLDQLEVKVCDLTRKVNQLTASLSETQSDVDYSREHFIEVYNLETLKALSKDQIKEILKSDHINLAGQDEELVYEALLSWTRADVTARNSSLCSLLKHVRLLRLSADYIQTKILTDRLVSDQTECMSLINAVQEIRNNGTTRDSYVKCEATGVTAKRLVAGTRSLLANGGLASSASFYKQRETRDVLRSVELFDPLKNEWEVRQPMPDVRHAHSAVWLESKMVVLVCGGIEPTTQKVLNTCLEFHPLARYWRTSSHKMRQARSNFPLLKLAGQIYAIGGEIRHNDPIWVMERFNGTDWELVAGLPGAALASRQAAAVLNGYIYAVVGGHQREVYQTIKYDPHVDKWTELPAKLTLDAQRAEFSLIADLEGRKLLMIGGIGFDSIIQIDPETGVLSRLKLGSDDVTLVDQRSRFGAVRSLSGSIYVASGESRGQTVNTLERLQLNATNESDLVRRLSSMMTARWEFPLIEILSISPKRADWVS